MKKVLNYSITWNENDEQKEILIFTHKYMIRKYIDLLENSYNISLLKVWKIYNQGKEDYTDKLNSFIAYGK